MIAFDHGFPDGERDQVIAVVVGEDGLAVEEWGDARPRLIDTEEKERDHETDESEYVNRITLRFRSPIK